MRVSAASVTVPLQALSPAARTSAGAGRADAAPDQGDGVLHRVMIEMMRQADADASVSTTRIRRRSREAAEARTRILREIHKQARARRRGRRWGVFKKFLLAVGAVVGAAAAIVASPFTGGGSLAAYVGTALGVTAAVAGAAGAAGGIAQGVLGARAGLAGVRSERASGELGDAMRDVERDAAQACDLLDHASRIEERAIQIEQGEEALSLAVLRRAP
ncbi:MAG: hypothetical protein JRG91_09350 [Deltaproteobacteria bacterium]|nr:hypothetical protein [Deltaproteobacteria bacterium]